jgi:hypothetical protein
MGRLCGRAGRLTARNGGFLARAEFDFRSVADGDGPAGVETALGFY